MGINQVFEDVERGDGADATTGNRIAHRTRHPGAIREVERERFAAAVLDRGEAGVVDVDAEV
jgi:hypothetical protein